MRKIGAHLSITGGIDKALDRTVAIGANALQIFSSSPRGWNKAVTTNQTIQQFKKKKAQLHIDPVYFHASYLINLANADIIGAKSKEVLIAELTYASQLEVKGSVIHLGSFKHNSDIAHDVSQDKRYSTLISNILDVLTNTPKDTLFIIENAGNRKIGQSLEEIAAIVRDLNDERVRICLDTCHLFSGGYNITNKLELDQFIQTFDKLVGMHKIELLHVNDSKDPFASGRDRHENIGDGTIGQFGIQTFIAHPSLNHLPLIIETPGFENKGPDKANIDLLKKMI